MKFGEMDPMYVPPRPTGIEPRVPDEPDPCVICGELPATEGIYCRRCAQGLDDDAYERACNR